MILWFFTSLVIWFYWRTVLFSCRNWFFYCICTVIFIWIIYTLGTVGSNFGWTLISSGSVGIFLAIILSDYFMYNITFNFNSELVKSPIVVRSLFMIWYFDFSSFCRWSIIFLQSAHDFLLLLYDLFKSSYWPLKLTSSASNILIIFSRRFCKMLSLKLWILIFS